MSTALGQLGEFGIAEGQSRSVQRRIKNINAVAAFAFVTTALFAVLFLPAKPESLPFWAYAGLLALYLVGYASVLLLNRVGNHEGAAALLLGTGLLNVTAVNFTVGFRTGTAVFLVVIAIGAVLVTDPTQTALRWSVVVLTVLIFALLVVFDPPVAPAMTETWVDLLIVASFGGLVAFAVWVVWYQRRLTDTAEAELIEANAQSQRLLLNILPADIAERLRAGEYPIADAKPDVTVLFADIVGSTAITDSLTATDLVTALDVLFSSFDDIASEHGLEKIKTVGDSYFAVAGLASEDHNHTRSAADAALSMREQLKEHRFPGMGETQMRFGLHTGPVMAGVIGKHKFSYDLWGDTVNTASRMESTSDIDMIQVSQQVYDRLKDRYELEPRGRITIKGKGDMSTYSLIGERS